MALPTDGCSDRLWLCRPGQHARRGCGDDSGAVISNGTVQLGVNDRGDLNYDCVGAGDTRCPGPSAGNGSSNVGLRYVPLNLDAISPGCACEGWGLADAGSGLTGYANERGRREHHHRQLQRPLGDRGDLDRNHRRRGDHGLPDADRPGLSSVAAQPEPVGGLRHGHEHGYEYAHRPPVPPRDGLGRRANGLSDG